MSRMVQIRNVPDGRHRKLKARAADSGRTLSDYLLIEAPIITCDGPLATAPGHRARIEVIV